MAHVTDFKEAGFNTLLEELEWRGLISQSTDRDRLAEALNGEPITYYCGFDPTAASLHIGNLVQLINMRHLQLAGHHPIALVGGATGLIGDPRQSGERTLNPKDVVAGWADRLKNQIGGILDTEGANAVRFVSNYDWTASMTVIDFLRDVGKNFRLGTMLAKDTVARRLNSEEGISFTEFSYQVLQGNDFNINRNRLIRTELMCIQCTHAVFKFIAYCNVTVNKFLCNNFLNLINFVILRISA